MRGVAQIILSIAEIHLLIGAIVTLAFAAFGIPRVLPHAGRISWGARLIVLPAAALLWPAVLYRWRR